MSGVRDSFLDLERRRLQLEQNVARLQTSLRHWQSWEIEYEGMKEEILGLGDDHDEADLKRLGEDTGDSTLSEDLLTAKERKLLLIDDNGNLRKSEQVFGLLSRRVDYVQQNIKTISSLLTAAEEKYAASQVLTQPEVRNEDGLPLTEIHEELDEEGNVVSSSTSRPGEKAPQMVEALRKAGVDGLPEIPASQDPTPNAAEPEEPAPQTSEPSDTQSPKKSVSFAEGTKAEAIPSPNVVEKQFSPVIPIHESPEDADLRSQMIKYNMEEVGAVVAELELDDDEEASAASYSDDGSEDMHDDSSIEDEDKFGRTKRRVLDEEYLAEMRELEERLNAKAVRNVGPDGILPADVDRMEMGQPIEKPAANGTASGPKSTAAKGVRFAPSLSVQPAPQSPYPPSPPAPPSKTVPRPGQPSSKPLQPPHKIHAATIIERPPTNTSNTTPAEPDEFDSALLQQEVATEYHKIRNRMIQRQGGFAAREDVDEEGREPLREDEGGGKKMSRFKAARLGKGG